ncbi:MAG: oxidoreductase [Candidatus Thermofonsia Clade 1 bacterium]|jgi:NADP-dependent 3-hydroxy acid dehydrogenase YdfG|uniref:Oxidoreductase n=1 Tax=Candidatus Thermofonsia Clade 1 bacterium TaxID=2364210 RepID=A0A2M8P3P5_9CHLR|nr:MAG: oxidoreductase [Candidatus Thermofonsia Clade 1 bacterium]
MQQKVVVIAGAGRGIGRALALKLAAQGARLALCARTYVELNTLADEVKALGAQALPISADMTVQRDVANLIAETQATYGRIDAVYYGAGVGALSGALELKESDLDRMWETNFKGLFHITRAAIPHMLNNGGGHFVVPVGILGRHVMRNSGGYSASKFAVVGWVKALGEEFNKRGIRFTLLYLGGVNTSFWDSIEMRVDRSKMLTAEAAADVALYALSAPSPAVINEIVMQPDSHQFI